MQIRLFAVSKCCPEATKRFLTATNHGDLNLLIEGHFGTDAGPLTEKGTFEKILTSIKQLPEDVLFLTKSREEYMTAKSAKLTAVQLMYRRQAEKVEDDNVPVVRVRTLNELQFEWWCSIPLFTPSLVFGSVASSPNPNTFSFTLLNYNFAVSSITNFIYLLDSVDSVFDRKVWFVMAIKLTCLFSKNGQLSTAIHWWVLINFVKTCNLKLYPCFA